VAKYDDLDPEESGALRERVEDLATEFGLDESDLRDFQPEVVIQKVLRTKSPMLAAGYGRGGIRLAPIRRASRHAVVRRQDHRASESALTARWNPPDAAQLSALLADPSTVEGTSLDAFAGEGVEAFSLYAPRGRRYALVFQGRSAWARFMHRALTGHR
jgi:hypothetical protein